MNIVVELQRVGRSRVSYLGIPIIARVLQGSAAGEDLLHRQGLTDVAVAKRAVQTRMDAMFGAAVEIAWVDRTDEWKQAEKP